MSILRTSLRTARPLCARAVPRARFASTSAGPGGEKPDTTTRNAVVAGALIAASLGLWYYESQKLGVYGTSKSEPEFSVTIGSGARAHTEKHRLKSDADLHTMLHEHEVTSSPGRAGNPVVRWDTNWVAANEPCEDRYAADIVPRGNDKSSRGSGANIIDDKPGKRDLVLVSIIDGHAGDSCSRLLARALHPSLAISLAGLQAGIVPGASWYSKITDALTFSKSWSPSNISKTLQEAYVQLDDNICWTPIKMLPALASAENQEEARAKFLAMAAPATAGAVVNSMLVDAENDALYLANAGDVRSVAGWQRPDGSWRCDTLTEDLMGDNPKEVARMRAEHPPHEADSVIRNGRVQGGLQPTRAFGDAIYKWTTTEGAAVADVYRADGLKPRNFRQFNFTPPYVTARPQITHRSLKGQDGEKLRFVVMATDGLWDRISSEEATVLMAGYLAHPKHPDMSKEAAATESGITTTEPRPYPIDDMPGTGKRAKGSWAYEGDSNAATHLIKNAFGGADRKGRGELLSVTGKITRYLRDDVTITVVFFDDE